MLQTVVRLFQSISCTRARNDQPLHRRSALRLEAVTTVDWSPLPWFKWHLGRLPALVADHVEHWPVSATAGYAAVSIVVALASSLRAASWTPDRIHEAAFAEEALFPRSEDKLRATVTTHNNSVFAVHVFPDSLCDWCAVCDTLSRFWIGRQAIPRRSLLTEGEPPSGSGLHR